MIYVLFWLDCLLQPVTCLFFGILESSLRGLEAYLALLLASYYIHA
jgi:hypothetical protein